MAKSRKKQLGRILFAFLLIGMAGVFAMNFYQQEQRLRALGEEQKALVQTRDALKVEMSRLNRLYSYTLSDEYIEQYARERLGWTREGEMVFQLPEETEHPQ